MSFPRKEYSESKPKNKLDPKTAKLKIAAFCAYQERCQQEVRSKLYDYGLYSDEVEDLLAVMITEGFLNEERYAKAFVRGKFGLKKWGRIKIAMELKQRKISENCIKIGFREIDPEAYTATLKSLVENKWNQLKDQDLFIRKMKVQRFLMSKGYEQDLIAEQIAGFKL
ncbi:regulatory protein RecX [Pararhodonellum marinum]|uniref:regulatory protein RecX n=1 Tax=Pararhodonellum marinum TaxID=2755358 RepID=UPI00188FD3D3|nr:regulatory protein RecX [Pararhodonellum marinum]